jgi:hypothetical protein
MTLVLPICLSAQQNADRLSGLTTVARPSELVVEGAAGAEAELPPRSTIAGPGLPRATPASNTTDGCWPSPVWFMSTAPIDSCRPTGHGPGETKG